MSKNLWSYGKIVVTTISLLFCFKTECASQVVKHLEPWRQVAVFDGQNDTMITVGMTHPDRSPDSAYRYRILLCKWSGDFHNNYTSQSINFYDSFATALASPRAVVDHDDIIVLGGQALASNNDRHSFIWRLDRNLNPIDTTKLSYGISTRVIDLTYDQAANTYLVLGDFKADSATPVRSFLLEISATNLKEKRSTTFGCNRYEHGCNFWPIEVLTLNGSERLVTYYTNSRVYADHTDVGAILLDSAFHELRAWDLHNDTFCFSYTSTLVLNDSVFIACNTNHFFQPKRYPDDPTSVYPYLNDTAKTILTRFSRSGVVEPSNFLRQETRFIHSQGYQLSEPEFSLRTRDDGYLVVGRTRDTLIGRSDEAGFAMKLDRKGNFLWYRIFRLNNGTPKGGKEMTYVWSVYEQEDRNLIFSGEYYSSPSDSFPKGTQHGLLFMTDEYGCLEPGCNENDNIEQLVHLPFEIRIYPNPSRGETNIESARVLLTGVDIYDLNGQLVASHECSTYHYTLTGLKNGLYLLVIKSELGTLSRKVVFEN